MLLLLLLLSLSAAADAVTNNRCAVLASVVCVLAYIHGASSRELGERHASYDVPLPLLLQLRLLWLLRVLLGTAAAAAAAAATAAAAAAACFAAAASASTYCRRHCCCCLLS